MDARFIDLIVRFRPIVLKNSNVPVESKGAACVHLSDPSRKHDRDVGKGSSTPENEV